MKVIETKLKECFILEPKVFEDKRGYFFESFNEKVFYSATGLKVHFVQDNESRSIKGVLRGLHFQKDGAAQAKLVRVIEGSVLDVAVDIRKGSATFGQYEAVELTGENKRQFFVPRGFAHGFVVLSDFARFSYKCDNFYTIETEGGISYNDPDLAIDWKLPDRDLIISDKDTKLPLFKDFKR